MIMNDSNNLNAEYLSNSNNSQDEDPLGCLSHAALMGQGGVCVLCRIFPELDMGWVFSSPRGVKVWVSLGEGILEILTSGERYLKAGILEPRQKSIAGCYLPLLLRPSHPAGKWREIRLLLQGVGEVFTAKLEMCWDTDTVYTTDVDSGYVTLCKSNHQCLQAHEDQVSPPRFDIIVLEL